jgi:hypothetical protein
MDQATRPIANEGSVTPGVSTPEPARVTEPTVVRMLKGEEVFAALRPVALQMAHYGDSTLYLQLARRDREENADGPSSMIGTHNVQPRFSTQDDYSAQRSAEWVETPTSQILGFGMGTWYGMAHSNFKGDQARHMSNVTVWQDGVQPYPPLTGDESGIDSYCGTVYDCAYGKFDTSLPFEMPCNGRATMSTTHYAWRQIRYPSVVTWGSINATSNAAGNSTVQCSKQDKETTVASGDGPGAASKDAAGNPPPDRPEPGNDGGAFRCFDTYELMRYSQGDSVWYGWQYEYSFCDFY